MRDFGSPFSKILVVGQGVSGKAITGYLNRIGHLAVCENIAENQTIDLEEYTQVVISPGIPQSHFLRKLSKEKLSSDIEIASCRLQNKEWIGVTGSNGKTTTTLLITHILQTSGNPAFALGNVGEAVGDYIDKIEEETLVVELSSFQLQTIYTPMLSHGVLLNISPNHLDAHGSMEVYQACKEHLFALMKRGVPYVHEGCNVKARSVKRYGYLSTSELFTDLYKIYYEGKEVGVLPTLLQGRASFEVENFLAAFAMTFEKGICPSIITQAYASFKKPPHRLEQVAEINGVVYINDSKSTSIDATIKAVENQQKPIHLIVGGVHKGAAYTPWIEPFQNRVKRLYVIGAAAPIILQDLALFERCECKNLEEAFYRASQDAQRGEIILLSPGCASYDGFKNYQERGECFKKLTRWLHESKTDADHCCSGQ